MLSELWSEHVTLKSVDLHHDSPFTYKRVGLLHILPSRIVKSFEALISYYAQQPDLNGSQTFIASFLTVVTELVSIIAILDSVCHIS